MIKKIIIMINDNDHNNYDANDYNDDDYHNCEDAANSPLLLPLVIITKSENIHFYDP